MVGQAIGFCGLPTQTTKNDRLRHTLPVRWAVLVERLAGRRHIPCLEVIGTDRLDPVAGAVVVYPGELAPCERCCRRRCNVGAWPAANGVRLGLRPVGHGVLHGGDIDADDGRATDRVPSRDGRGAVAMLCPVCLDAGTMQAFEAAGGGMAVSVSVSSADDGDGRLRLGKPPDVAAVAAAMMVYLVYIQLPNGAGHTGFDVDVAVRVVAAEVAANLRAKTAVSDAHGETEIVLVPRSHAVGVHRKHFDRHRTRRRLIQDNPVTHVRGGALPLGGLGVGIVELARV